MGYGVPGNAACEKLTIGKALPPVKAEPCSAGARIVGGTQRSCCSSCASATPPVGHLWLCCGLRSPHQFCLAFIREQVIRVERASLTNLEARFEWCSVEAVGPSATSATLARGERDLQCASSTTPRRSIGFPHMGSQVFSVCRGLDWLGALQVYENQLPVRNKTHRVDIL